MACHTQDHGKYRLSKILGKCINKKSWGWYLIWKLTALFQKILPVSIIRIMPIIIRSLRMICIFIVIQRFLTFFNP